MNMLNNFINGRIQLIYSFSHQLVMSVYGFGLLFFMLRVMPQEEVGRWILFVSCLSISDMLMHGFLQTMVVKESTKVGKNNHDMLTITNNAAFLALILFVGIALIGVAVKLSTSFVGNEILLVNDFYKWYPILGLLMLLFNLSWWTNTGTGNFKRILIQRIIFSISSAGIILGEYLIKEDISFDTAVFSQIIGYLLGAIYAFISNRFTFSKRYIKKSQLLLYYNYGKYTIGTMLGSSLLRNSDTFMIAAFIDTKAVTIYVLAQKIIEIFEVILRSLAATLLPSLYRLKDSMELFYRKWFAIFIKLTVLFLPITLAVFICSETIIYWVSGAHNYQLSANILRIFMVYVLLLPVDRLIGIALEIYGKPQLNLIKTMFLIIMNIGGNYVALKYFNSLIGVAAVSSLALLIGIISGFYFLSKMGFSWRYLVAFSFNKMNGNAIKTLLLNK